LAYVAFSLLCVVAVLLGARLNRPVRPLAWYLLGGSTFSFTLPLLPAAVGDQPGDRPTTPTLKHVAQ
jgi:hypothetical protein